MGFAYENKRLHFVGAGGVSMSALMRICRSLGAIVSGSDRTDGPTLRALREEGFDVAVGHREDVAARADTLVYTSAVKEDDPERAVAKRQIERSELLGEIAALYPTVIAVAGTHGKTTVTGMLACILRSAGVPFTAHIGGKLAGERSGAIIEGNDVFLTEACEYKRHFLTLRPTVGVVTNVEYDHPDCYENPGDVYRAFATFGAQCGKLITEDEELRKEVNEANARTNAHTNISAYAHIDIRPPGKKPNEYLCTCGDLQIPLSLGVWGGFNLKNAAYAVAAALELGIAPDAIGRGLAAFRGAERRQQTVGEWKGMPVVSDYAHHPTEISALTKEARAHFGTVAVVFEPHTYSRTRALMDEFATCFDADQVYLLPTFGAREPKNEEVDKNLFDALKTPNKIYADWGETRKLLARLPQKYYGAILFVGAGNVDAFAKELVASEQK